MKNTAKTTKTTAKKANKNTVASAGSRTQTTVERQVLDAESIKKKAEKCSNYNDSRSDSRNFKCIEVSGVAFKGENLSGIEAHYSKWSDCFFEECTFTNGEFYFSVFENCTFKNCSVDRCNFSFAQFENASFANCNMESIDISFAHGDITCSTCMMSRCTAQNTALQMSITDCNAYYFEANSSRLNMVVAESNMRRSEFNDAVIKGSITKSDLCNTEFNRADLTDFQITETAISNIETENALGIGESSDDFDDDDLDALFD